MRPLRLLLSLASSLVAITLLLYLVFGSHDDQLHESAPTASNTKDKGKVKSFFSFTSPASLFPPSAIISLTDDNSTFFLARPANFGPLLPTEGLSGPLWIGSGFGDEAMWVGELGCSDVPGWNEEQRATTGSKVTEDNIPAKFGGIRGSPRPKRTSSAARTEAEDNGTDDHLHHPLPASRISKTPHDRASAHAAVHSLQKSEEIKGKVVLLKRGGCGFLEKTKWAQRRGGVALIVGDDVRGGALIVMNARGDTSNVTIPAIFTSYTTAHLLSSLLPSESSTRDLSPEDAAKLKLIKGVKGPKHQNAKNKSRKSNSKATSQVSNKDVERPGWIRSVLTTLGLGDSGRVASKVESRQPSSSGSPDWVRAGNWEDDRSNQMLFATKTTSSTQRTAPTSTNEEKMGDTKGDSVIASNSENHKAWFGNFAGKSNSDAGEGGPMRADGSSSSDEHAEEDDELPDEPDKHEGLWVTLAPTNMSSSPFFDTLLVLVVSPLVTLTVVYALLLLRSRIRRRRWRAPKSVVERLPVRTYHTISDAGSSPTATPNASSPTTPLLQHAPSRPTSSPSRPPSQSQTQAEAPAPSSAVQQSSRLTEEEKREAGLAEWRRRYGGRQKECVVCLEEYVDGISRVMSLPCGHEFHADCITPWLVTRRRTCPICKGDVVRSLSQSYLDRSLRSPSPARTRFSDEPDGLQIQAAETRNDSPSASRPVPISSSSASDFRDNFDADIEANWADEIAEDGDGQGREIPGSHPGDLSSSVRELSSTVTTTIWRGFEAVRSAAGLQRRPSQSNIDRDR